MRIRFLLCLVAFAITAWGQTPTPPLIVVRNLVFAPVGVATTETIQINVANTAANNSTATASCSGTIFFNVSGAKTQPSSVKFTVTAGEISSTSIAWTNLGVNGRAEVQGSIQLAQNVGTPCAPSVSLETFDTSSGVTHTFQSTASNGPVSITPVSGQ